MRRTILAVTATCALLTACGSAPSTLQARTATSASPAPAYEVWAVDQGATSPAGGGTILVYRGSDLAGASAPVPAYTINLAEGVAVGDGVGKEPHMITFNAANTHAIVAFVGSGHVQIVRIADRKTVGSIRMTPGSKDGARQAHNLSVSPEDDAIIVANQGGRRVERIKADFRNDVYTLDAAGGLDLASFEDATHPGTLPVAAVWLEDRRHVYVPLRGGGSVLVDAKATPMKVDAMLSKAEIGPSACCALVKDGIIWTTAQGGPDATSTSWNLYKVSGAAEGTLKATSVLRRDGKVESHSVIAVGRAIWVGDRFANQLDIFADGSSSPLSISLATGPLAGRDPAPDILDRSPDGNYVFVALRGKTPVNGNIKGLDNAVGDSPGFAVLRIDDEGRGAGVLQHVPAPLSPGSSLTDIHALRVRLAK